MSDCVAKIEVYLVNLTQDKPYLGALREGETVNSAGYFVRKGNRTVYPRSNRSLVVKITTKEGVVGWGETYGLVAPGATAEIILDLLAGFVIGRNPLEQEVIHDELYDLMRVRGYTGGFYLDALAAIDIALWDIAGKIADKPIYQLLGGLQHEKIPAYVSGLPEETLEARVDLAVSWQSKGYDSFKFAMPVADDGVARELNQLRVHLGADARIACDLHWAFTSEEAIDLAKQVAEDKPWFLEAPVATEDIAGLAKVAQSCEVPIAVGEEWRTEYDARYRIDQNACQIVQPEMGHTGITQFMRIARYAEAHQLNVIPHATIGAGIFLAASLQASAALRGVSSHEFQHSIFEPFRHYTDDGLKCDAGFYDVSDKSGLGVNPGDSMIKNMSKLGER